MSFYLSNADLNPTSVGLPEFLDLPLMAEQDARTAPVAEDDEPDDASTNHPG
jgi:hypothetical protein